MSSICFYFHVHQPYRIRKYTVKDIGSASNYFEEDALDRNNKAIFNKVAQKCYLPTNKLLLKLLKRHPEFRISFSITGVLLEQAEEFNPEVLQSFRDLIDTGRVEIIGETYYHSLSFLYSKKEFNKQVELHLDKISELFKVTPTIFRNTELIYSDELGKHIEEMGYKGILAEGADHVLGWRSPNFVYSLPKGNHLKLLLKNYTLSDDIAFRFSDKGWKEHPLSAQKFAQWVSSTNGAGQVVNLFMDYETFGEHQWEDTGIFDFMEYLPAELMKHPDNDFVTPSEAITRYDSFAELTFPHYVSWADIERDLSAWRSNAMQYDALEKIHALEEDVLSTEDPKLIRDWRRLTTSDHFYYMCTKWFNDGDVHKYFSPYESPYEAFINFMNVIQDLKLRVEKSLAKKIDIKPMPLATEIRLNA
ncbi:glycoside hydrolase family 57 protein [Candidatus Dojkabacteria bacterium]|uniref:Glycoside hydrolase family 57 protein n=1 Tax=Candidatus Dojkabacteria bacterium TaxID=2099670 RepID=A0A955L214_9BACT|nr:glycoside hydrolase family 57 protein [Candidatus Dojkabacteria bacterium]